MLLESNHPEVIGTEKKKGISSFGANKIMKFNLI